MDTCSVQVSQSETLINFTADVIFKPTGNHNLNSFSISDLPAWLSCLPLKGDLIEAKVVREQLCSMVERSDKELLGPNYQYTPKIVSYLLSFYVLARILQLNKLLVD